MFTRPPFLIFQHNHQCDTLLPIVPCTHKLKAGIAYCKSHCMDFTFFPSGGGGGVISDKLKMPCARDLKALIVF